MRIVHLGLGAFHRAHQAWYTESCTDGEDWGIAAFTGRSATAALELQAQAGVYTVLERGPVDRLHLVGRISRALDGARVGELATCIAAPDTSLVTLTVTEAGYRLTPEGMPDRDDEAMAHDITWLQSNLAASRMEFEPGPRTPLARLLAGLESRRRIGADPIAIVPCDNMPENARLIRTGVRALAEYGSPDLADYLASRVTFVSTSVDRITPGVSADDIAEVEHLAGYRDGSPVVTEPFHDWVLEGEFPAGRPHWESAGARFVSDIEPFERRKLWLLNGAHTLLAYAGTARGHTTVAEAIADQDLRGWIEDFWDEAAAHLDGEGLELDDYRAALLERFANPKIRHQLDQIGVDGVTKLRVRIVPIVRAERRRGRAGEGAARVLAAWSAAARDRRLPADRYSADVEGASARSGVGALLRVLDPQLADDAQLVRLVEGLARGLEVSSAAR
ncbi:mannitol dehydrogenase family protein [Lysobacter korlensis]|uniref:Mannitol dehydrogenase family protein n=1 Tax=Lysobacter korlensis TaxID=553636 RepID=A0ABV6RX38_9GAMM